MGEEEKFKRKGESKENKKKTWYEANRCDYENKGCRCYMLGTRGTTDRKYCTWHVDVVRISDAEQRREFEKKKNFEQWYRRWRGHFDLYPSQWSGKSVDILWDSVKCEPSYRV